MVMKKLVTFFSIIFLLGAAYFVIADHVVTPASYSVNESLNYIFNISVSNTGATSDLNITQVNVTLPANFIFYAGSNSTDALGTFSNTSSVLSWQNSTALVMNNTINYFVFNASYTVPGTYTINVTTVNLTSSTLTSITVTILDTSMLSFVSPGVTASTNLSQTSIAVNLTSYDFAGISNIAVRLHNSSGEINSSNSTTSPLYINFTGLVDGTYYVNATMNDSNNNVNNTATLTIRLDTTAPQTSSISSSKSSTTATVSWTTNEDSSSVLYYGTTTATSSTSTNNTLTSAHSVDLTGLSASTLYYYNVSSCDSLNQCNTSIQYNFTTSNSSSSSSTTGASSNDGSVSYWILTYYPTEQQQTEGYSQNMVVKSNMKVNVSGTYHYVGVVSLGNTSATINVSSTPQQAVLNVGNEKKFEVSGDGYYDIAVKLESVTGTLARLTVKRIHELMPASVSTAGSASSTNSTTGNQTNNAVVGSQESNESLFSKLNNKWVWIIGGAVVLIAIVLGAGYFIYKRKY